jgi:hypothetical protein
MKQRNPFHVQEYVADQPFCGRREQVNKLVAHARDLEHVVLFSSRRTGKTTLIQRVQKTLSQQGAICCYADFFGVASVEDLAARIVQAVFEETCSRETLFKRASSAFTAFQPLMCNPFANGKRLTGVELVTTRLSGFDLLRDVLKSLGIFIRESAELVYFAFDEFQEITSLPQAFELEKIFQDYVHRHASACIFAGSRRELLCSMFTDKRRPFFREATLVKLSPVPLNDLTLLVTEQFRVSGKLCSETIARQLVTSVASFPYYVRKLACLVFENSEDEVATLDLDKGLRLLLREEEPCFEAIFLGLAPGQIALLRALANEPSKSIFAQEFIQRHRLGSIGGAQGAKKKMLSLDLIEFREQKWQIVDPVFVRWLNFHDHCTGWSAVQE